MDLLTDIAVGDIAVIRTPNKLRRLGQPRNQAVRVMELELDDARAAKVQVLGRERIARRGNLQKVHIETAEEATTGRPQRVVTVVTGADGKTTVTAGPGLDTNSIEDVARAEMRLADDREATEIAKIREDLRIAREPNESDGDDSGGDEERAGPAGGGSARREPEEEDERDDAGRYINDKGEENAGARGEEQELGDAGGNYWGFETGDEAPTAPMAFWARHLRGNKIPEKDVVDEVWLYSVVTGGAMPSDELMGLATGQLPQDGTDQYDDDDDEGYDSDEDDKEYEKLQGAERHFTVLKARKVRDETCPTNKMLRDDPVLDVDWTESWLEEYDGLSSVTHEVTKERAREVGVTPHVTDRRTKRNGRKKTRININGSFEVRRGRFPDKHKEAAQPSDGRRAAEVHGADRNALPHGHGEQRRDAVLPSQSDEGSKVRATDRHLPRRVRVRSRGRHVQGVRRRVVRDSRRKFRVVPQLQGGDDRDGLPCLGVPPVPVLQAGRGAGPPDGQRGHGRHAQSEHDGRRGKGGAGGVQRRPQE